MVILPPSPKLCECGCGQPAPIAKMTNKAHGYVKGQPMRFVLGHAARKNDVDTFWARVDKESSPNGCWLWRGKTIVNGYGQVHYQGKPWRTHRLAYVLTYGPIPDDLAVCHNCPGGDNPLCVNPSHLWLGTGADNTLDATYKGQMRRGEEINTAKLTAKDVLKIRSLYKDGHSERELAARYGVHRSNINYIVRGITWKHLEVDSA